MKHPPITGFRPVFKIQGKVYHLIGSLLPPETSDQPKFAQIYFTGSNDKKLQFRMSLNDVLKNEIITELEKMMQKCNSYAMSLKYAMRNLNSDSMKVYYVVFVLLKQILKISFHCRLLSMQILVLTIIIQKL